jgi:hypothetical protein
MLRAAFLVRVLILNMQYHLPFQEDGYFFIWFAYLRVNLRSWGSSVSIVSDYRLEEEETRV